MQLKFIISLIKINIMKLFNYIAIITILIISCKQQNEEEKTAENTTNTNIISLTEAQLKHANIETGKFTKGNISSIIKVNGRIDVPPQNLVSISAPLGGYLKTTKLLPGMHINKGEIIAILEDQQFIQIQEDYLLTKSKLHYATLELNRQKEMNQSLATSNKNVVQAEAELSQLKIMINALTEKLKLIHINPDKVKEGNISKNVNIYSPISGYVSKVNVNIGKYISPTDIMFELINPADIHLNLHVFEKDIPNLSIGQDVHAYTNTEPDIKYLCNIILISKDVAENGTTEVHCHFENYSQKLLPGMYMNAELNVPKRNGSLLPEAAVVQSEGKTYIFIAKNKTDFELTPVQTGTIHNDQIEILNASTIGNNDIVIQGAYTLLMKMKNNEEE
jgi:cobalt-zinc-cadmium efflux system membrane fusion protein